jgi:tyrosyl-tRNA synthetase
MDAAHDGENNAEWLTRLEYIPFLRDIGRHFSVNRMVRAESYADPAGI